jgi:hypothetical protein
MQKITRSFYTRADLWAQIEEIASAQGVAISTVISRAIHEYLQKDFTRGSWDTLPDDDWYDEQRFYTYSQDKKGHSSIAKFALPKNIAGGIKKLVDSGNIPELRSAADFYRNAIFHWARKVNQWVEDGEFVSELSWQQLRADDETIEATQADFEDWVGGMKKNMDRFLREKDYAYMENYINVREQASSHVPERHRAEYDQLVAGYKEKLGLAREGKLSYLD